MQQEDGHHKHQDHPQRTTLDRHDQHGHNQAESSSHSKDRAHNKHAGHSPEMFKWRFFICLFLTLPILYFSPLFQEWFGYTAIQFPGVNLVSPILGTAIYFYGGWVFLQGALREFQSKIGMMTLIALAITVAYVYSLAVSLGLRGEPFYWELATLVDVMLLGHWIELVSVQGASRALEHLADLVPSVAHRLVNGQIEDVSVGELAQGEQILIRPGEQIPIDGEVKEGVSSVNEAFLTGESRPVTKQAGDEVVAGAVNGEGALTVVVTRTGEQTTLSQVMRLVEEAQSSRGRFQALADQIAYWLTLIAIGIGTLTLVIWLMLNPDPTFAINRSVTVLVITCPHALGLAIPLVMVNATSMSAKNGILVRNREAFERARNIKTIAFDKTGTLTEGQFGVQRIYAQDISDLEALAIAAALESLSEHPLAQAVVQEANNRKMQLPKGSEFQSVTGKGIEGVVNGKSYRVGRSEWAEELGLMFPTELQAGLEKIEARGESAIALLDNSQVLAIFGLADKIRERAREAVQRLQVMDVQVVMITGDAEAVAKTVAAELNIEQYYARVLPQDKAAIIQRLKAKSPTAFVGDGINDAAALFNADLGIAIGAGTNVAIESADLVLVENDPLDVTYTLQLAKATYNKMIQNLFWATGYNVVGIPLAAGVAAPLGILLSPALGAVFMSLSTVIVSINAMLLRRVQLT
ncbi:heavy metal translocating P-type ATPase [Gloeocapsopsis sp. IPPAS B-1203]|uniref:heavy metal translocating P-type ATPase n=1 Tax=Gloeocapsopsis sp. IPPAS B-1203 TaxID=2049454 RepID=UPI000C175459|nr:heavy metal translocating P-type ATPase [Gloeocapsopsis sp. IPPAS B-1203]PIG91631.1 copper-translocating P-type ATPase [Gloeocapsopsis sp. IPPAS B-1203]